MKKILFVLFFLFCCSQGYSACPTGQMEVIIHIVPDSYPTETSWNITDSTGSILSSGGSVGDTICVNSGSCLMFSIFDSFGDGIFSPGGYWLYVDGILVAQGSGFGSGEQVNFNCPPGLFCTDPLNLAPGTFTAPFDDTWYIYSPSVSGTYTISTCSLSTCNTAIWVYSSCPSVPYTDGIQGTFAFNDDYNCGTQAVLDVVFLAGHTYFIRIGDNLDSCSTPIDFSFAYSGPIRGCTDITACNYNPIATVDDSSCIYYPNPLCGGPDLQIDSAIFANSLSLVTRVANNCDVAEGCVTGYGTRYVISFTSRINNIGTLDYYIGNASTQPGMFNSVNCHGHAHYEGYGDYRLFDSNGFLVPAGHKNGYCVIDLCGFGQYTCGNMGISAGCYDAYGSGTQCQWIDITDVPTGDYRIAVIINSQHLPDALGRHETNYVNNATQVCVHITHNISGPPTFTLLPACTPYVDCTGLPGGASEMDCNNICNGPAVYGDMYQDAALDSQDVYTYMDIMQSSLPATNCNDLNRDGSVSVYDAALINWCKRGSNNVGGSAHNHCNFPRNIINPNDLVGLGISTVNFTDNYVDIEILNPLVKVAAYQFTMTGIAISSVVSLADPVLFPVDVRFISSTNEVIAISLQDSLLERSTSPRPLVRIYFNAITDTVICLSEITDIINQNGERTMKNIMSGCTSSPSTFVSSVKNKNGFLIVPNPASNNAFVHLFEEAGKSVDLKIIDASGKSIPVSYQKINDDWFEMDLSNLPRGIYIISYSSEKGNGFSRLVKM